MNVALRKFKGAKWDRFIRLLCEDEKKQTDIWRKQGKQDQKYYPIIHFPFEKNGIKKPGPSGIR